MPHLTLCLEPHKVATTDWDLCELGAGEIGERDGIYLIFSFFLLKEVYHLSVASQISVQTENHHSGDLLVL